MKKCKFIPILMLLCVALLSTSCAASDGIVKTVKSLFSNEPTATTMYEAKQAATDTKKELLDKAADTEYKSNTTFLDKCRDGVVWGLEHTPNWYSIARLFNKDISFHTDAYKKAAATKETTEKTHRSESTINNQEYQYALETESDEELAKEGESGLPWWLIPAIIVAVILLLLLFFRRRRTQVVVHNSIPSAGTGFTLNDRYLQ